MPIAEVLAQQHRDELEQLRQHRTALLEREVAERARLEREVIEICARKKRRIAYDLHDGVGQQPVAIALSAKLLEQELRSERRPRLRKPLPSFSWLMKQPGTPGLPHAPSRVPMELTI